MVEVQEVKTINMGLSKNQRKLDLNKNNKLDKQDFMMLRNMKKSKMKKLNVLYKKLAFYIKSLAFFFLIKRCLI